MRLPFPVIDCLFDPVSRGVWLTSSPAPEGPPPVPLPRRCFAHPEELAVCMEAAGVRQALVTQCRVWNCERQPLCEEQRSDDVLKFVRTAPQRFAGLAGFNPFDIAGSLRELDDCAAGGGFYGVYLNAETFTVSLADRKLYPLYAKAVELGWPVVAQFGASSTPAAMLEVSGDFPELVLVGALRCWPNRALLEKIVEQAENACFIVPPRLVGEELAELLHGPAGERLMWGSDGAGWAKPLAQLSGLAIAGAALRRLLCDNAMRVFKLSAVTSVKAPAGETLAAER